MMLGEAPSSNYVLAAFTQTKHEPIEQTDLI